MKQKEKLERGGWVFQGNFLDTEMEIYARGDIRILYLPKSDNALAYYNARRSEQANFSMRIMSPIQFEIFCEKK